MNRRIRIWFLLAFTVPNLCFAQLGGGGLGGGVGGGNDQNSAGIKIDSDGVLNLIVADDGSNSLDKKRRVSMASMKRTSREIHQRAKLRIVSLVELEKSLETTLGEQKLISEEQFYLAGLRRIDHVFVFPDENDVCIAGPADGFVPDPVGRMISIETGRPVLRLDDMIVAMRTVLKSRQLGCSIDPVPSRLADLMRFIRQGEPAAIEEVEARFNQMDDILGLQDVRIDGVPTDSHFATILVEADYRMKRISIGIEKPQIKGFKSHLMTAKFGSNSMQRWWFVPFYDAISRSEDGLAYELIGQRAQLLSEDEVADFEGNRSSAAKTSHSTIAFAKHFTEKFPELANKSPTFAELQNLIDFSVLAALLTHENIAARIGWKQTLLLDEERLTYPIFDVPKSVPSQVNYRRAGNQVLGLVCGGVIIHPAQVYAQVLSTEKDSGKLSKTRELASTAPRIESHQWWWDVEK